MIRVEKSECIGQVFGAQEIATMTAFGSIFVEDGADCCEAGIVTASKSTFFCTRHRGHEGVHIAVGIEPVAIFDEDATDFHSSVDDIQF